MEETSI